MVVVLEEVVVVVVVSRGSIDNICSIGSSIKSYIISCLLCYKF